MSIFFASSRLRVNQQETGGGSREAAKNAKGSEKQWRLRVNNMLMSMLGRSGLFGLLSLFCAVFGTCDILPNGLNPADIGQPPQRVKLKGTDEQLYGPYKGKSLKALWRARDEFFKDGRTPTGSNELQRLRQWYQAMDNADPAFGSKTPIEFYGKAMDQYGNPVPSARVDLYWGKGTNLMMQTQQDGSFILSGVTGAGLDVRIYKNGYDTGHQSYGSFDYVNFFDHGFHLPDPTNPVIFRLQKLENPEPMYVNSTSLKLDVTNTVVWVDVCTGEKGATGDIGFSMVRDEFPGKQESGYTLNILTRTGGAWSSQTRNSCSMRRNLGTVHKKRFRTGHPAQMTTVFTHPWNLSYI